MTPDDKHTDDMKAAEAWYAIVGLLENLPEDARHRVLAAIATFYGYDLMGAKP